MAGPVLVLFLLLLSPVQAAAQQPAPPAARVADRTAGLTRADGFIPFYWDEARGRVLMEIPAFNQDVLYYVSAASGGGSVEMSFDRGIMSTSVIHFHRSGPRVLVVEQNLRYRAVGGSTALVENVRDSFPSSVLAALPSRPTRPAGCSSMPHRCSCAMPPTSWATAPRQPGHFPLRTGPQWLLPRAHEGVPRQHRDRDHRHLRRRQRRVGW